MRLVLSILILFLVSGCSRWAIDRHNAETAERIDVQLHIGMTTAEFQSAFPAAKLIGLTSDDTRYLVSVQEVCFWCFSGRGFVESNQVFARTVTFENDLLVSIDPVPRGVQK